MPEIVRLGYEPRAWQHRCHLERKRFTVLALHRRAGKTELAIMELMDKAVRFKGELGFFVYVAPYLKQAIVGRASRILANPDAKPRDVARASSTLLAIERLTLDAAKEEDRIARLDNGGATESMVLHVITGVPHA